MKKTLIALLALGSMAVADEPITYTFTNTTGEGVNRSGGCAGISFQLGDTSRMDVDQPLLTATFNPLYIQSIAIKTSDTQTNGSTPLCMFIVDSDLTLLAVSESCTPTSTLSEVLTFNFNETASLMTNPEVNTTNQGLSGGTQYYAFFLNADRYSNTTDRNYNASIGSVVPSNDGHPWADSNTVALSLVSFPDTTTAGENAILSGSNGGLGYKYNQFGAFVTITAKAPEPATATLSLLALAGLAARRRRH